MAGAAAPFDMLRFDIIAALMKHDFMAHFPWRTTAILLIAGTVLSACDRTDQATARRALVESYCLDCHNLAEAAGNLTLEQRDHANVAADAEVWERVVRKLRAGVMPPSGEPRPDGAAYVEFVAGLETDLDRAIAAAPHPGRTEPFHRLNRNEYRNAIRDLLDVEVDVSELLPADDSSYGFDNIAGVLKISPTLLERYLAAAEKVSRLAVGTLPPFPNIDYFRIADDRSQEDRLPGLPFGTRGGTSISYTFPMDAEYVIAVDLARNLNESLPLYYEPQNLEVSIDGERLTVFTLDGVPRPEPPPVADSATESEGGGQPDGQPAEEPPISQINTGPRLSRAEREARNRADENWQIRVPVSAGRRDVTVTFLGTTAALDETPRLPFLRPYPSGVNIPETRTGAYLRSVEISGPYGPARSGEELQSRQRIFVCEPPAQEGAQPAPEEAACARTILETLARRAYRRPVTDADIGPLLGFFEQGRSAGGFDEGIQLALKRLLVAPEFLFRIQSDPEDVAPDTPYRISDFDLASRLSFFLWSSMPDDELLLAAEERRLGEPVELERQVSRMLADPRADAFIENFAGQWLFLRNLDATVPVQSVFPDFDDTLREGLRRETELFFASVVREDRSALELLNADYTFLNERVARHYGISEVKGSHFRRVTLPEGNPRRGLLGHGSILAVTSYPDRTSPVVRGKWILENLLGTPAPPPLPNVPELASTDGAGSVISMRERLALHRADPECASCHQLMDPLGFSLENFDAIGRWRAIGESGERVDATGTLPDGTAFDGLEGLREALQSSDQFVMTMTEKMLTYGLGRGLEYYDMPAVRAIVRDAAAEDHRFSAYVNGIVQSVPFRMRRSLP